MQNEAIKLAIRKGFYAVEYYPPDLTDEQLEKRVKQEISEIIVLDPLFWQALGKALGWRRQFAVSSYGATEELDDEAGYSWDGVKEDDNSVAVLIPQWQHHAHQYFDLVLTSGDTEKFWLDLLNPNRE